MDIIRDDIGNNMIIEIKTHSYSIIIYFWLNNEYFEFRRIELN